MKQSAARKTETDAATVLLREQELARDEFFIDDILNRFVVRGAFARGVRIQQLPLIVRSTSVIWVMRLSVRQQATQRMDRKSPFPGDGEGFEKMQIAIWCASWRQNGLRAAPVLEFGYFPWDPGAVPRAVAAIASTVATYNCALIRLAPTRKAAQ